MYLSNFFMLKVNNYTTSLFLTFFSYNKMIKLCNDLHATIIINRMQYKFCFSY